MTWRSMFPPPRRTESSGLTGACGEGCAPAPRAPEAPCALRLHVEASAQETPARQEEGGELPLETLGSATRLPPGRSGCGLCSRSHVSVPAGSGCSHVWPRGSPCPCRSLSFKVRLGARSSPGGEGAQSASRPSKGPRAQSSRQGGPAAPLEEPPHHTHRVSP